MKFFKQTDGSAEAAWFARRRDPQLSRQTEDAFQTWLAAQPRNAVGYGQCELAWERSAELAGDKEVRNLLRAAEARAARGPSRKATGLHLAAAVAAMALLSAGGFFAVRYFGSPAYQTEIGEQRDVRLPDGSHVTLNTATRMVVHFSDTHRSIELISGEALFEVRKDPSRPFEVFCGGGIARALGTRFTVERAKDRTTVSVLEGIVALLPGTPNRAGSVRAAAEEAGAGQASWPVLESGQSASITPEGHPTGIAPADIRRIEAWQDRKLDFESAPLGAAIAEVNRYAPRPLVLAQPALADLKISGVFHIASLDGFAFALERTFGLRVVENGDELLVMQKTENAPAQ